MYVDLATGVYHADSEAAGADPSAFARNQADHFGFETCSDCFETCGGSEADGGEAGE